MSIEPNEDGLVIPEVGPWAKRKYHFVGRYLSAFTTAMRGKWNELHYIDLFAGAGFARIKSTREIVLNCAALAATTKHPFTQLHLCDESEENAAALRARLARTPQVKPLRVLTDDCNSAVVEILREIPASGSLAVSFIDPFGLHVNFETIGRLADRRSDLIVLVPDGMDVIRNWKTYYKDDPTSNLDRFLGSPEWRDVLQSAPSHRAAQELRKFYQSRLDALGFKHFEFERVTNVGGAALYVLLFASRHDAGAKIWRGVTATDEGGQRSLPWE